MDHLCYFCLVLLCFRARLFADALWSPAGKGLIVGRICEKNRAFFDKSMKLDTWPE